MKCPGCQTENPDDKKFCRECAARLVLACPQCGYDLFGIPQARCPECGFGFDYAALRHFASTNSLTRYLAARAVITWAGVALACTVPALVQRLQFHGVTATLLIFFAYLAGFAVWYVFSNVYDGVAPLPVILAMFVGTGVGVAAGDPAIVYESGVPGLVCGMSTVISSA